MIRNNIRSKIITQISNLTALFCLYNIVTTSIPCPLSLKGQHLVDNHSLTNNREIFDNNIAQISTQDELTYKLYLDLHYHKLLGHKQEAVVTHISLNKEGKIVGYKPTKLRLINYPLEKQVMTLVKKNISIVEIERSIYWLNLTNKYYTIY